MSWEVPPPSGSHAQPDPVDPVESLLARCLAGDGSDSDSTLDALCRDHPEHAAELRSRFSWLVEAGLTDPGFEAPIPFEQLGGFRVLRRIGGGGMGVVYLARDDSLGREVALKVIRPEHADVASSRERFRREIATIALLEHPGIVPVYSVGEERGIPFFTMERVHGATLGELLADQRGKPVEQLSACDLLSALRRRCPVDASGPRDAPLFSRTWIEACLELTAQIADALHHAHERGVLHRDVKPTNVMLTLDGRARLLDFGLATRADLQRMTNSGAALGSVPYMSPEQVRGETLDRRSDVYALGVTLYELLALKEAFLADTGEATRQRILEGRPAPLRILNRRVPADVETVCFKAMDLDPRRRYANADDFSADLRNLLEHRPTRARRPGAALAVRRWVQRRPTLSVALALGALLLFGVPLGLYLQERRARVAIDTEAETARRATQFLVDLFEAAGPRTSLGKHAPVSLLLDEGMRRIRTELKDQPRIRSRLLNTFGLMYHWFGAYAEAESLLREELELHRAQGERWNHAICSAEVLLADVLTHQGRAGEALARIDAGLATRAGVGDVDVHDRADLLMRRGIALEHLGRAPEAEAALRESVQAHRAQLGRTSCGATDIGALGGLLLRTGRESEGLGMLRECAQVWREIRPQGHPSIVQSLNSLATGEQRTGDLSAALATADEALHELERIDGQELEIAADAHRTRAEILDARGERALAESSYRKALGIYEHALDAASPDLARTRLELGRFLLADGRWALALSELDRAMVVFESVDLAQLALLAQTRTARAGALAALGRTADAAREAHGAIEAASRLAQPDPGDLARAWLALAWAQALEGNVQDAENALREATPFVESAHSPQLTAMLHNHEAFLENRGGHGAPAETAARKSLDAIERAGTSPSIEEAQACNLLGWARMLQGDSPGAREFLTRSAELYERIFPDGHPEQAYVVELLGMLSVRDDPSAAAGFMQRALELRRRFLEPRDPLIAHSIHNYAAALARAGEDGKAEPLLAEAIDLESAPGVAASAELVSDLYFSASIRLRAHDPERAVELARKALSLALESPGGFKELVPPIEQVLRRALVELAALYDSLGRAQDAEDCRTAGAAIGEPTQH